MAVFVHLLRSLELFLRLITIIIYKITEPLEFKWVLHAPHGKTAEFKPWSKTKAQGRNILELESRKFTDMFTGWQQAFSAQFFM